MKFLGRSIECYCKRSVDMNATHLLNKGIRLEKVSKYLRHQNLSTTMAYLRITTADIQREIELMGDPLDEITGNEI
jgi:integrase/recombinase XerD